MVDTTAPIVAANVASTMVTGAGVVLFGISTGLDYPTLLAGVLGGAFALSYSKKTNILARIFEVISASLLAGYAAPFLSDLCLALISKGGVTLAEGTKTPQLIIAIMVGYLAHGTLLPGVRKIAGSLIRRHSSE